MVLRLALLFLFASPALAQQVEVRGLLPYEAIRRVVMRSAAGTLEACYSDHLIDHPRFEGRFVVRFVIAADGSVASVEAREPDPERAAFARCIESAIRPLRFPSTGGGTTIITWPFEASQRPPPGGPVRVVLRSRGPYVIRARWTPTPLFGSQGGADPRIAIGSTLEVSCAIFIDGIAVGSAPRLWRVPPRETPYHISIRAEGYGNWERAFVLRSGRAILLRLRPRMDVAVTECVRGTSNGICTE